MADDRRHGGAWIGVGGALLAAIIGLVPWIAGLHKDVSGNGGVDHSVTLPPPITTPPTPPPTSPPPTSPTATEPLVRHAGLLTLEWNGTADLDATPDHRTWQDGFSDLWYTPPVLNWTANQAHGFLSNGPANYGTCHDGDFSTKDLTVTAIQRAKTICVLTTDERISALRIDRATSDELKVYVTTYNKDGD